MVLYTLSETPALGPHPTGQGSSRNLAWEYLDLGVLGGVTKSSPMRSTNTRRRRGRTRRWGQRRGQAGRRAGACRQARGLPGVVVVATSMIQDDYHRIRQSVRQSCPKFAASTADSTQRPSLADLSLQASLAPAGRWPARRGTRLPGAAGLGDTATGLQGSLCYICAC